MYLGEPTEVMEGKREGEGRMGVLLIYTIYVFIKILN